MNNKSYNRNILYIINTAIPILKEYISTDIIYSIICEYLWFCSDGNFIRDEPFTRSWKTNITQGYILNSKPFFMFRKEIPQYIWRIRLPRPRKQYYQKSLVTVSCGKYSGYMQNINGYLISRVCSRDQAIEWLIKANQIVDIPLQDTNVPFDGTFWIDFEPNRSVLCYLGWIGLPIDMIIRQTQKIKKIFDIKTTTPTSVPFQFYTEQVLKKEYLTYNDM